MMTREECETLYRLNKKFWEEHRTEVNESYLFLKAFPPQIGQRLTVCDEGKGIWLTGALTSMEEREDGLCIWVDCEREWGTENRCFYIGPKRSYYTVQGA